MATGDSQKLIAADPNQAIAYNPSIVKTTPMPAKRNNYMQDLLRLPFDKLYAKYCKDHFAAALKNRIKRFLRILRPAKK